MGAAGAGEEGRVMARLIVGPVVLLAGMLAWAAAPPPRGLNVARQKELQRLAARMEAEARAGRFDEAQALARRVLELRTRWQGAGHWQTFDARLEVEQGERVLRVPRKDWPELTRAARLVERAAGRHREADYKGAAQLLGQAITALREILGDEHPETLLAYNNLADALLKQGDEARALRLHEKVLLAARRSLGERHPLTAVAYNNLAASLTEMGQPGQALPVYRKALSLYRAAAGEDHPQTAARLSNVATTLDELSRHAEALPLHEQALAIHRRARGERHPDTAMSYNNLAHCLAELDRNGQALPLYQKALGFWRQEFGDDHPQTAVGYNNVACCLGAVGRFAEGQPLHEKCLDVYRKILGEGHPEMATAYLGLAECLSAQGQYARALPLYERALAIKRAQRGEGHPDTAMGYHKVADCLVEQRRHAAALALFQKALAIRQKHLGEDHPRTFALYAHLGVCLHELGQVRQARRRFEEALVSARRVLGEENRETALCYNNLAVSLPDSQAARALELFEKGLAVSRKALGEDHPQVGLLLSNTAVCLHDQGRPDRALPLLEQALRVRRRAQGEGHPDSAATARHLALSLWRVGRMPEAVRLLQAALPGYETARFHAAPTGLDRAVAASVHSPRVLLALGLAKLGQPVNAHRHAEASLARALLDDVEPAPDAPALPARLRKLDEQLLPLFGRDDLSADQRALRERLVEERRAALALLARLAADDSARRVLPLDEIQRRLAPDEALVLWLDEGNVGEHAACVVRRAGPPAWVPLPGTGKGGAWTATDRDLPSRLWRLLGNPNAGSDRQRQDLLAAARRQRLDPLRAHLGPRSGLPAVRRLLAVPTGWAARIPVEVLTDEYRVSYVPSGSVLARLRQKRRPLSGSPALALGDPAFDPAPPPAPPEHGVLILSVLPGSPAAHAGLRGGDVLLRVGGARLASPDDLLARLTGAARVAEVWREGKKFKALALLRGGPLGVSLDPRPAPEAVRSWRESEGRQLLRGQAPVRLPGTRREAQALARLAPGSALLLGSEASEPALRALASSGKLTQFRIVHLGTHGLIDDDRPERSRLTLARDRVATLSEAADAAARGLPVVTGELSVADVLRDWRLDADLVVLSACRTAMGRDGGGEGLLGFAQAFLQKGARSVLLTRWEVEDVSSALLMERFYQNLLGKRPGLKGPMGRAAALAEARSWLRGLSRAEALGRMGALAGGVVRGRAEPMPALAAPGPQALPAGERPFAHPFFWAGFVLVGEPD